MKALRAIPLIGAFLIVSCSSGPQGSLSLGPAPEYRREERLAEVIDHEDAMPQWAIRYLEAGVEGVETLPEYGDSYVFIDRQAGSSLEALRLWAAGFSVERDFSRLVASRIQKRFVAGSDGNPAEEYGRYFETVVKSASGIVFQGAVREGGFWVKKRIFEEDGVSPAEDVYEYLIMASAGREALRQQIDMLLITARPDKPATRDQSAASMRLRLNFFEGF
jgi:hypothetical protein